jgi:hypothetical protein
MVLFYFIFDIDTLCGLQKKEKKFTYLAGYEKK